MKTILCLPGGRVLLIAALFCNTCFPAFAQELITTPVAGHPNKFTFSATLPDLPVLLGSAVYPYYDLLVHFGDGNFERALVYKNAATATGFSFLPWQKDYTYSMPGNYRPTISLTAKYSPPELPPFEFIGPTITNTNTTVSTGAYSMTGNIRRPGRDIGIDTSHRIPYRNERETTFALGWTRSQNIPGGSIALLFNGTRHENTKALEATGPGNEIMTLKTENRPFPIFSDPAKRRKVLGDAAFGVLSGNYDSVLVLNNLTADILPEGRSFLCFKNKKDITFTDKKVSLLALYITKEPLRNVDYLNSLEPDGFGRIKALSLPAGPNNSLAIGGGYLYDWIFYEEKAVYVHDPNELIITSMVKRTSGDFDMKFDFISCSHYKSNSTIGSATIVFDPTILQSGPVMVGAEQPSRSLAFSDVTPAGGNLSYQITGLALAPGGCFTMHLTGVLKAADEEQAFVDGKILRGCVRLDGEISNDPADLCSANLKFDERRPVPPPYQGPCAKPGLWNWLLCLCEKSPLPCWLVVALVLAFLLWLFFKKKN